MKHHDIILKYALENAVKYDGKANEKAVLGKVLAENPDLRSHAKELIGEIQHVIKEISSMSVEEQKKKLEEIAPELLGKKEVKERGIFYFMGIAEGQEVKTAFPPEPSKYPHIGHAKAIIINYELAKTYNGKFVLRFEDTNPELAQEEFYKIHMEDYRWLGITPDKIDYASDYMEKMYEYAEKIIHKGRA